MTGENQNGSFSVLFVCTGNVCRSPTAQALLKRRADEGMAGDALHVGSAGMASQNGWRMDPTIIELLAKRGVTGLATFRSRALTDEIVAGADLVLTGTREHRLKIGKGWPDAYSRTFTLREASNHLAAMPPQVADGLPADTAKRAFSVLEWLQEERGLGASPAGELDIEDPIGRRTSVYRRMVDDVCTAVDAVARALLPTSSNAELLSG